MTLSNECSPLPVINGKINILKVKKNQYTLSLLNEALHNELITLEEFKTIQVQLLLLLKDLINLYTKGESSSLSVDTAESLLNSIIYAIDAYTICCNSPEEALSHLLALKIKTIYEKGIEQVGLWFHEANNLYKEVKKNKLNPLLEAYNLTINEGIPLFLKNYGILFTSHHTMANIDYPLTFDDMSLQGVLYIKNYLKNIKTENEFCNYFDSLKVERLLGEYGRMIQMDYTIELINIFELVVNNAVFSEMVGNDVTKLLLSNAQADVLNHKLLELSSEEIKLYVEKAFKNLVRILKIIEPNLLDYLQKYSFIFLQRIINAVKHNSLSSIIITQTEDRKQAAPFIFKEGEQLSTAAFNLLIKNVMKLTEPMDKVNLINNSIHSLHDFIDILNADYLFGDEYRMLFHSLSNPSLAILAKIVFYEEFRSGNTSLAYLTAINKVVEHDWQSYFIEFITREACDRIVMIEKCFVDIAYEEIKFF